jgi:hypothetical protein
MGHSGEFVIKNYGKKSTFASFLPGISGTHGIPIWCHYVNRGQCIASFGVCDKDHAIMEFYPAHQSYQNVKSCGFRTFIRKDGKYSESFADENRKHSMTIKMNELVIEEINDREKLTTTVVYNTLPGEKLGALMRKVTVKNTSDTEVDLELVDGMPAIIPYGVGMESMKTMGQTTKAWMQVEYLETKIPYYRVRVSMEDTAEVTEVLGGNFCYAIQEGKEQLQPIVDPEVLFGYDNSLTRAVVLKEEGLKGVLGKTQNIKNLLPSGFYWAKETLAPGGEITIYELFGQVESRELLKEFFEKPRDGSYFEQKREEAQILAEGICSVIETETADTNFDAYCRYSYFDNVLRGGYPMQLGSNKVFYLYSRKHGDLERDYNYFSILPEFYSQGNGNFRDVIQNRRCDNFFTPFVERANIKSFFGLLQLDGYNPLIIEKITYYMKSEVAEAILKDLPEEVRIALCDFVKEPYTPGALYQKLDGLIEEEEKKTRIFIHIIDFSQEVVNGSFGEGYWSDHWTYLLDLIENYLEIYPEYERDLLLEEDYTYFLSRVNINKRCKRYEETREGIRQYHALNQESKREPGEKFLYGGFGKGAVHKVTLLEKLLLLCTVKYAALDAYGMGIEMEGGKSGWNDALNGLPGMLGSSMAEACELGRVLNYTVGVLKKYSMKVSITKELGMLIEKLAEIDREEKEHILSDQELMDFWNRINDAKEEYRESTYEGISGDKMTYDSDTLLHWLEGFRETVFHGIEKARAYGGTICPTYFVYEVTEYEKREEGIFPVHMRAEALPHFLEGPVRYLKLYDGLPEKKKLYQNIKNSDLYDQVLSMYKLNESLENTSYEIGRARAFTPGWLENESIWLHMEYKYLLEILKSGLYEEFFTDFHKAAIPFLDYRKYGRSILENSSFLASSKNPNERIHGKGFVARLSGSTVEFINIWKLIMFGGAPFFVKNGKLALRFSPAMPKYLIREDNTVKATFLGDIEVIYQFERKRDYYPGNYTVTLIKLIYKNGHTVEVYSDMITGKSAADIRDKKIVSMTVTIV